MDPVMLEIAEHAIRTVSDIVKAHESRFNHEVKLNMIFNAAGIFVTLQRSIYRAQHKLYQIDETLTKER